MKFVLSALIALAAAVVVLSSRCDHQDSSACNMNCTDSTMIVGCEHEICTCVVAPVSCNGDYTVCTSLTCEKHGEEGHCVDTVCQCVKLP